jgi:hypothetical protein
MPRASTQVEGGNTVLIMADRASRDALRSFIGDSLPQHHPARSTG